MFRPRGSRPARFVVEDGKRADQTLDRVRDDAGFHFAYSMGGHPSIPGALVLAGFNIEGRDSRVVAGLARRGQRREAGLSRRRFQQVLEVAVHVVQNGRARPEVGRDSQDRGRVPFRQRAPGRKVRLYVRAAEPVNGLFGISNQKQRARTNGTVLPGFPRRPLAAQSPDDFGLQRVRVLKFVDQNVGITRGKRRADRFMVPEEVPRLVQQIVEVEQGRVALEVPVQLPDLVEFGNEALERDTAETVAKCDVRLAARVVQAQSAFETLSSKRRAQPGGLRRRLPFPKGPPPSEFRHVLLAGRRPSMMQQTGEAFTGHGTGAGFAQRFRNVQEIVDDCSGAGLFDAGLAIPPGEIADGAHEPPVGFPIDVGNGRSGRPVLLEKMRGVPDQLQGFVRRLQHHGGEEVLAVRARGRYRRRASQAVPAGVPSEPRREPGVHEILEDEVRRAGIQDGCARVPARFHRVRRDQFLAEAVDSGAGQLVERIRAFLQVGALGLAQSLRQGRLEFGERFAGQQVPDDAFDAFEEFGGGRFCKGDGGDAPRRDASGHEQRRPTGHERRLAAAGARLDEQGAIVAGQRLDARIHVGRRRLVALVRHLRAPPTESAAGPAPARSTVVWLSDSFPSHPREARRKGRTTALPRPDPIASFLRQNGWRPL